jgi:uncharacterized protein (DUF1330 family)
VRPKNGQNDQAITSAVYCSLDGAARAIGSYGEGAGAMKELSMPGYVFMHADVTDPDGYEKFKSLASAAIADHGGRYLVRGGAMQPLEGQWCSRVVLLEFPTYEAALAFYNSDAYQDARQVRLRSSTASVLAMDGVSES